MATLAGSISDSRKDALDIVSIIYLKMRDLLLTIWWMWDIVPSQ